jgi:Ser/Thr protein kinase RdoA (MazF antagonist)
MTYIDRLSIEYVGISSYIKGGVIGMNDSYDTVANLALSKYPQLHGASIQFFGQDTNINYLVEHNETKYFMKIYMDHSSTIDDNIAEAVLLEHLTNTTDLHVPTVIKNQDNAYVTTLFSPSDQQDKHIMIATFLSGEALDGNETKERMEQLGRTMAILHNAAKSLVIPKGVTFKQWDQVLYWRKEEKHYHKEEYKDKMSVDTRRLLDQVFPYLDKRLPALYQKNNILVHGDLNPWNVLIEGDQLKMIDFEDTIVGTPIHDIAITLFYYRYDLKYTYQDIRDWLLTGYQDIVPNFKPDWEIVDMLIIARTVNFMNFILLLEDDPNVYIEERARRVRDYLSKYNITFE